MSGFKNILKKRTILFKNQFLTLVEDLLNTHTGLSYNYYHILKTDCVMVIVVEREGDDIFTHLVCQYRHPIGKRIWQFPAGGIDLTKNAVLDCAKRELREETGILAQNYEHVGDFFVDPGLSNQKCAVFIATGPFEYRSAELEATEEDLVSQRVNIKDIPKMIMGGDMDDSWGMSGYFFLIQYIDMKKS